MRFAASSLLRPETSRTCALAMTVRPTGVGAKWRTLTSLPTVSHLRCQDHHGGAEDERHAFHLGANRALTRNDDLVPAGTLSSGSAIPSRGLPHRAAYSNVAPQDPPM
jgi:hypothetical protein